MSSSPGSGANGGEAGLAVEGEGPADRDLRRDYDILCLRAPNAGPVTLSGTNTWIVGRKPAWVIDPGPRLDAHLERLFEAIEARRGLGGVVLTHDHHDHSEAVPALLARHPAPVAAGRGQVDLLLKEGAHFGPFESVSTPGHAPDHFALIADGACFTGDAVLGEGSVFISPYPGAMAGYLLGLTRLRLRDDVDVLCPGHGPPVWEPQAKLEQYIDHRIDRENKLIVALGRGCRSVDELLDAVWSDVPESLRSLAAVTLAAHLDKLDEERTLPQGVERPSFEQTEW